MSAFSTLVWIALKRDFKKLKGNNMTQSPSLNDLVVIELQFWPGSTLKFSLEGKITSCNGNNVSIGIPGQANPLKTEAGKLSPLPNNKAWGLKLVGTLS